VKGFLQSRGIAFEDRDVTQDEEALAELERHGFMTTPLIAINGEVVVGDDPRRLSELLGLGPN